jgi:membrane-anchored protein YejM (alkaline phosphatase superfamily)
LDQGKAIPLTNPLTFVILNPRMMKAMVMILALSIVAVVGVAVAVYLRVRKHRHQIASGELPSESQKMRSPRQP